MNNTVSFEQRKKKKVQEFPGEVSENDPKWMSKKKRNKRLDEIEIEEYFHFKHENGFAQLQNKTSTNTMGGSGVPSTGTLLEIMNKYHLYKKTCLASFGACEGNRYNNDAISGFDMCRDHPFMIWEKYTNEKTGR